MPPTSCWMYTRDTRTLLRCCLFLRSCEQQRERCSLNIHTQCNHSVPHRHTRSDKLFRVKAKLFTLHKVTGTGVSLQGSLVYVRTCVNIYNRVSLVSAWTHNLSNLSFVTPVLISRHFKICTVHCRGYNQDRLGEVRDATNIEHILF